MQMKCTMDLIKATIAVYHTCVCIMKSYHMFLKEPFFQTPLIITCRLQFLITSVRSKDFLPPETMGYSASIVCLDNT